MDFCYMHAITLIGCGPLNWTSFAICRSRMEFGVLAMSKPSIYLTIQAEGAHAADPEHGRQQQKPDVDRPLKVWEWRHPA
jgi:hypothetical protein